MIKRLGSLLRSWIVSDNHYHAEHAPIKQIDWARTVPFILIHLSCLFVFFVNATKIAIGVAFFLYFFRLFAICAFYHRYFSHKAFKTNRFWQFIFAALAGMAGQRGPLWWASHHRQHHMVSDTPADVHSPVQHGFWWSHVGWILSKKHFHYNPERVKDLAQYPELVFLDRYDTLMPAILFVILLLAGWLLGTYIPQWHTGIAEMLVWGFSVSLVALFHTTVMINSLCHVYGSRRYDTPDSSRNNLLFALLTLGEGWHNNHHHYPASARQGFFWWEIDITYYLIQCMALLGIVWDIKPVPKALLKQRLINNELVGEGK